jgi:hypothetical protein
MSVLALRPADDFDRINQPLVPGRARRAEVFESSKHIEVPLRRKRKPAERPVHLVPGAV